MKKEGVSDRWCTKRGGLGKEREDGTLENKSSKQKPRIESRYEKQRSRWKMGYRKDRLKGKSEGGAGCV